MQTVLIVALVTVILMCAALCRVIYKLVVERESDREWNQALFREIERAGWVEQYNAAFAAARLSEWDRQFVGEREHTSNQAAH